MFYVLGSYGVGNLPSFSDQFMSDPMLNAARQIGGHFAVEQKEKVFITNDLRNMWESLLL